MQGGPWDKKSYLIDLAGMRNKMVTWYICFVLFFFFFSFLAFFFPSYISAEGNTQQQQYNQRPATSVTLTWKCICMLNFLIKYLHAQKHVSTWMWGTPFALLPL
jgi:hypothetical protein